MDFLDKLSELFGKSSPESITKEIEECYKLYGFDPKKPPTDSELARWSMDIMKKWYKEPDLKINLPLTAFCLAYNITTLYKLDLNEQINLKTLLATIYNMGYNMGKYKLKSPLDEKPQLKDLN